MARSRAKTYLQTLVNRSARSYDGEKAVVIWLCTIRALAPMRYESSKPRLHEVAQANIGQGVSVHDVGPWYKNTSASV